MRMAAEASVNVKSFQGCVTLPRSPFSAALNEAWDVVDNPTAGRRVIRTYYTSCGFLMLFFQQFQAVGWARTAGEDQAGLQMRKKQGSLPQRESSPSYAAFSLTPPPLAIVRPSVGLMCRQLD